MNVLKYIIYNGHSDKKNRNCHLHFHLGENVTCDRNIFLRKVQRKYRGRLSQLLQMTFGFSLSKPFKGRIRRLVSQREKKKHERHVQSASNP